MSEDATKDEVNQLINSYYAKRHLGREIDELKRKLSYYRITEEDWAKREPEIKKLSSQAEVNDLAWGLYNLAITRAQSHDDLSRLYWDMAYRLYTEGRNCFEMRRRAARESLLHMKEQEKLMTPGAIKGIRVLGACTPSSMLENKIIKLDDAISNCPIPCKDCDRDKNEDQSWCACCFNFEFND